MLFTKWFKIHTINYVNQKDFFMGWGEVFMDLKVFVYLCVMCSSILNAIYIVFVWIVVTEILNWMLEVSHRDNFSDILWVG